MTATVSRPVFRSLFAALLTLLVLDGALALAESAAPKYDRDKLPYRAAWGPYTIVVERTGTDDLSTTRLQIRDKAGSVLREVRDQVIGDVSFPEITGGGSPELYVSGYSGGAHCCTTEYYFTREKGLRNLLIFHGNNGAIEAVKDLDGDGRPEMIAHCDALAYFGGLSYAGSPGLIMVIGWNGRRYADLTRKFPERTLALARRYQADFLKVLKADDDAAEEQRKGAAAGYYANSVAVGRGAAARAWLLKRVSKFTRQWLLKNESDIRAAVASCGDRIAVSQARVLEPKLE